MRSFGGAKNQIFGSSDILVHGQRPWPQQRLLYMSKTESQMRLVLRYLHSNITKLSRLQDETRPFCQRCAKAGFPCEGFPHPLQVVFDRSVAQARQKLKERHIEPRATLSSVSVPQTVPVLAVGDVSEIAKQQSELVKSQFVMQPSIAPSRSDMYSAFLVNKFLTHVGVGAVPLLNAWNKLSPTTNDAVHALAISYFGKMHHDKELLQRGSVSYGKALASLSKDLAKVDAASSTSVLLSTFALTLYEVGK